jgi:ATP phosphoribosyltransferase regulatory subunit HisZ
MTPLAEAYDKALHASLAPSTRMAVYLRSMIKDDLDRGRVTREAAFAALEDLYDRYAAQERWDERNAVADVMDGFVGWSSREAQL